MTYVEIVVFLVAIERVIELIIASYNTRRLKAEGAIEVGKNHYFLFILLHTSWLGAIIYFASPYKIPNMSLLFIFILLQLGRIWIITTLGKYWTTRIITLPHKPLIKTGPYRFLKHPNYIIVCAEIALLPLIFGLWQVALVWSIANAALLVWRIYVENNALQSRRNIC
ncbi:MAG: hypothetical protein K1X44_08245 [Alphaproteobacteria bacterium]|nr:hypothetical protein [Alphaproteobacteria bacterium]